jgi:hypothetical protein
MVNKMLVVFLALALVILGAACSPQSPEPLAPADTPAVGPGPDQPAAPGAPSTPATTLPEDEGMQRGNVFIDGVQILTLESFPPQFNLVVTGNLPTPCHQLRYLVNEPDAQNNIDVEVFSLVSPDQMCIQVLQPFEETISLGSYAEGTYSILVNGQLAGEIKTP